MAELQEKNKKWLELEISKTREATERLQMMQSNNKELNSNNRELNSAVSRMQESIAKLKNSSDLTNESL